MSASAAGHVRRPSHIRSNYLIQSLGAESSARILEYAREAFVKYPDQKEVFYIPRKISGLPRALICNPRTRTVYVLLTRTKAGDKVFGSGTSKKIKYAFNLKNETLCAIGIVKKGSSKEKFDIRQVRQEVQIWKRLREFKEVVRLHCAIREGDKVFMIQELMRDGDLCGVLMEKKISSLYEKIEIAIGVIDAVMVVHREGVIHRDIKTDNIFLHRELKTRQWIVKIGDFGLAKVMPKDELGRTFCGTAETLAPEIARKFMEEIEVDLSCIATDIWSVGCVFYSLFYEVGYPWAGETQHDTVKAVSAFSTLSAAMGQDAKALRAKAPQEINLLIDQILSNEPERRPNGEKIRSTLLSVLSTLQNQNTQA